MDLSGYDILSLRDGDITLSRGSGSDGSPILLATAEGAAPARVKRLEHEFALKAELDSVWAARPIELVRQNDRMTLVLEDPGGESLERSVGHPMPISEFLNIAIPFARAIHGLHQQGLVHKDIKPSNVLVDVANSRAWLTGFGIASRVPREHTSPEPPESIVGTLAYMSPEQTGRMNRSIDSRSDLYSFGVTLYELLTGVKPFVASDPMEWVHCHIARRPIAPSELVPSVLPQLSAIVMKLLAKTAEDRYQTAAGVESDLRLCLAHWEAHGRIDEFPLARRDAPSRLVMPETLYGRDREIAALLAAFERVLATGSPELVLVSGYSGIGKSSVVNELQKVLVPPRGLFASGKFDQYRRDIPYATLAQAFQTLVAQILVKQETEVAKWRQALEDAVGANGQLVVNLIPEVGFIIGQQEPVANLPPLEARNRLKMVFRRFVGAFARSEHPLVLFLDDLQWLDAATLELLEDLVIDPDVRYLMLVGAYRDNEVSSSHPLMRTLQTIRQSGTKTSQIVLAPLSLDDVCSLVADAVRCEPEIALSLAQLVQEKTGGNPFFAIQFLTALADEGLLAFDAQVAAWSWDIARIRAKGYTENIVDFMVEKIKRLPDVTQGALQQLACLGNVVEIDTLTRFRGESVDEIDSALWDAVHDGVVGRFDGSYKFLHDRIQQAAYSLIPEERRPEVHLRIGRDFLARMSPSELDEHVFDVASQLNRGAGKLADRDEKARVATIDLQAGRKAKASAAFASARAYFAAGMALLDEKDWAGRYELSFSLWLERAECELLSGNFEQAQDVIEELLKRAVYNIDFAAASSLKVQLHVLKGEHPLAIESALTCLRMFGIDWTAHPTLDQVQSEYEMVWQNLEGRPVESLIDRPLMTDPQVQAVMQLLSVITPPAYFTDYQLFCLLLCRMANLGMKHGMSGAAAHAYAYLGSMLGPVFHRYRDAYRFAKLACDLVEKHRFIAYESKVYHAMGLVAFWTRPFTEAYDFMQATFRSGIETGDLIFACYGAFGSVTARFFRNDTLDDAWRESEMAIDFVRKSKYADAAEFVGNQQRFIATMQGRTGVQFDEAAIEAQLSGHVCMGWILRLKAKFILGDYAGALAAAETAKPMLADVTGQVQLLDYFYYGALTVAALYEKASKDQQKSWSELLAAHREQLHEWAKSHPPSFTDKHALVSAEIARLEGRDTDAMRLYELAIRSAHENRYVQIEGLAQEVAAHFYAARGFETIARAFLRNARSCYSRWGASEKVRQLDENYPQAREERIASGLIGTIDVPVEQLDIGTVLKASQAVSSEIELGKVIETLVRIALQHVGAERGVLILCTNGESRVRAEATTRGGAIDVLLRDEPVTPSDLPQSLLQYVVRTRKSVILDDAVTSTLFSADPYVQDRRPRSVLCTPLLKQAEVVGALYLENTLTARAFTAGETALLELVASQAAISLQNAALYADLRRSESFLAEGESISHTGTFGWNTITGSVIFTRECYRIFEIDPSVPIDFETTMMRVHPEDADYVRRVRERALNGGEDLVIENRLLMPDGSIKHVRVVGHRTKDRFGNPTFIGALMDITAAKRAEKDLNNMRSQLAHATRVTTLGELTASIAHEVNQPLTAMITNAEAGRRWVDRDIPNVNEARLAFERILKDGKRAGDVTRRVRAMLNKGDSQKTIVDVNDVVNEVIALVQHELTSHKVSLRTDLPLDLPVIYADRIQIQQVLINLVLNAIEAMQSVTDRARELTIRSCLDDAHRVVVEVKDCGPGVSGQIADKLFEAFFTTKSSGMGMGLSICRSIIEAHGGRLFASSAAGPGATFTFELPPFEENG